MYNNYGDNMNKKGFTLIELIIVIAILGIILVISIPKILDTISVSKNKFYSEQKRRLEEASLKYINEIYIPTTQNNIIISKDTLIEKGYIEEIYDIEDKTSICDAYVIMKNINTVPITESYINCEREITEDAIYTLTNTGNMISDETSDGNLRYSGSNPNNYVTFNNETWRIIGIFNVSNGTTTEPRIKLIRNESIGNYSFDNSITETNKGTNDYNVSTLKEILNGLYLNSGSGQCKTEESGATVATNNETSCDFTSIGLNNNSLIDSIVWNIGGTSWSNPTEKPYGLPTLGTYNKERGVDVYKKLTVTPNIIHNTTFTGKVGLIYPSDYGYASTDSGCRNDLRNGVFMNGENIVYTNVTCKNNNWLFTSGSYDNWTISPYSSYSYYLFRVTSGGCISQYSAYVPNVGVRPVIYLKPNVRVIDGSGLSDDPYIFGL